MTPAVVFMSDGGRKLGDGLQVAKKKENPMHAVCIFPSLFVSFVKCTELHIAEHETTEILPLSQ